MSAFKKATKRRKTADLIAELSCPISKALPIDPVTACDGRVYERKEIETYFKSQEGEVIKSPVAGAMIRKDLLPAKQHLNTIEHLVENFMITGPPAKEWKENQKKQELLKKAEEGDLDAMEALANNYCWGKNGFPKDYELLYKWSKKAKKAGGVVGMAYTGWLIFLGMGGAKKNHVLGVYYLSLAAERGSNFACQKLGCIFAEGILGFEKDEAEARRLLEQVVTDSTHFDHLTWSVLWALPLP